MDIANNSCGDDAALVLARALVVNKSIVKLELSNNEITGIGGEAIGAALKTNSSLVVLNLGCNPLCDPTAIAVADSMNNICKSSRIGLRYNTTLKQLGLGSAKVLKFELFVKLLDK